jgi:hypothetical protein
MKRTMALLLISAVAVSACRSQRPVEEKAGGKATQPAPVFTPSVSIARLSFDSGSYSDLFAPTSFAIWVDESVTAFRQEAAAQAGETVTPAENADASKICGDYVIIECHLDSVFADMSIAYDVVGLRGLNIYLSTPDGRKIPPIQTLIGTPLKQEPRQALVPWPRLQRALFSRRRLSRRRGVSGRRVFLDF